MKWFLRSVISLIVVMANLAALLPGAGASAVLGATAADPVRSVPALVAPGSSFSVTVSFTAPADQFNSIGLTDYAPVGWNVAVNPTATAPALMDSLVTGNKIECIWMGPYPAGTSFTGVYDVTVPAGGTPGVYNFGAGTLEYQIASSPKVVESVTGVNSVKIPLAPAVTTTAATGVSSVSAVLHGSLTSMGTAANISVSFQVGTAPGTYTLETSPAQSMTTAGAFSFELAGLTPVTDYYFRAKAAGDETSFGGEFNFRTNQELSIATGGADTITTESARLTGELLSLDTAASAEVSFEWGATESYGNETPPETLNGPVSFAATLSGLAAKTTYHYRAKVAAAGNTAFGAGRTFTSDTIAPTVRTDPAGSITENAARLNGYLESLGTATSVEITFELGETSGVYNPVPVSKTVTATGIFSIDLTGLGSGKTYYYRAKAQGDGIAFGQEQSISTIPTAAITLGNLVQTYDGAPKPVIVTIVPAGVTYELTYNGTDAPPTEAGNYNVLVRVTQPDFAGSVTDTLVIQKAPTAMTGFTSATINYGDPSIALSGTIKAGVLIPPGDVAITLNGVTQPAAIYGATGYFAATFNTTGLPAGIYNVSYFYAGSANFAPAGPDLSQTVTVVGTAPAVETGSATEVTSDGATLSGNLTGMGSASSVIVYFEYGETTDYGQASPAQNTTATGSFAINVTGLKPDTLYHFRTAASGDGVAFGADGTFTTLPAPPTVVTLDVTNLTAARATLNGNLTACGSAENISVCFGWGTDETCTTETESFVTGTVGTFSRTLSGLTPETTYFCRAKASGHGPAAGSVVSFTTLALDAVVPLTVVTESATNITQTSAVLHGNLTSLGSASSVDVGFNFSTTGNTTTQQTMTAPGPFSFEMTGLAPGNTYGYTAVAFGGTSGTAQGSTVAFTTLLTTPPTVVTENATDITATSAVLHGNLASLGTATTVSVFFGFLPEGGSAETTANQEMTATGPFNATLTGLTANTTYIFRANAYGSEAVNGEHTYFTTLPDTVSALPDVVTEPATGITAVNATLNGNLTSLGSFSSVTVYFGFAATGQTANNTPALNMTAPGPFITEVTGLTPGTQYEFVAFALAEDGTIVRGIYRGFDTTGDPATTPPEVVTLAVSDIAATTATLNGNLTTCGTCENVSVCFGWGPDDTCGTETETTVVTAAGVFSKTISGLTANTTYYCRAKASGHGLSQGETLTFTTPPDGVSSPHVVTEPASNVTDTKAILHGNLTSLGDSPYAHVGFEWGLTESYGNTTGTENMTAPGPFSYDLADQNTLTPGTTYHFRAFAAEATGFNADVIVYGEDLTFTTDPVYAPPSVATLPATEITKNSACLNGFLTYPGTIPVQVAFEWGPDTNYGATAELVNKTEAGSFFYPLTGLTVNTTYHYRAVAAETPGMNENLVVYGEDMTFTTLPDTTPVYAPVVQTLPPADVTYCSMTLKGYLEDLGGAPSVIVSFEWGPTQAYGYETPGQEMNATGPFSASISGLSPCVYYHFRAKVVANAETGYGPNGTVQTPPAPGGGGGGGGLVPPSVLTCDAIVIGESSTVLNGNLVVLGSSSGVQVCFEWGSDTAYGQSTPAATMTAKGAFNATLTGLIPGATYHFRSKATAVGVTVYGADFQFTTWTAGTDGIARTLKRIPISGFKEGKELSIDDRGCVVTSVQLTTSDSTAMLDFKEGTKLTDAGGQPTNAITAEKPANNPACPDGMAIVCATKFGPGGLKFEPPITLTLRYDPAKLPVGATESDLYIAYWDGAAWVNLGGKANASTGAISVTVSHFSQFAILARLASSTPARFTYTGFKITPSEPKTGEQITVEAVVANTGGTTGKYSVSFKVNGNELERQSRELVAGKTETITFTFSPAGPGSYSVDVNGNTGTVTVKAPDAAGSQVGAREPGTTQSAAQFNWTAWIIAVVGLAAITAGLWFLLKDVRL